MFQGCQGLWCNNYRVTGLGRGGVFGALQGNTYRKRGRVKPSTPGFHHSSRSAGGARCVKSISSTSNASCIWLTLVIIIVDEATDVVDPRRTSEQWRMWVCTARHATGYVCRQA